MHSAAELEAQTHEIEIGMETARKAIAKAEALRRLTDSNKDFKLLISEGYFNDESVRLVLLKGAMGDPVKRGEIDKSIDAIGNLYMYFSAIETAGDHAKRALEDDVEALNEIAEQQAALEAAE